MKTLLQFVCGLVLNLIKYPIKGGYPCCDLKLLLDISLYKRNHGIVQECSERTSE